MLDIGRMRELREGAGLNQEEAAHRCGWTGRQRWSDIEHGKRDNVTVRTLAQIAKALGCAPCDLLKDGMKVPRPARRPPRREPRSP